MRILLLPLGTRGDIQPFVALGKRLRLAGHDVVVCTSSSFAPWIESHGLSYAQMNNEIVELAGGEAGRKAMEGRGGVLGSPRRVAEASRLYKAIFRKTLAEEWEAAQGAEAIVYHPNAVGGYHIAEALGVPGIMADPLPTWVPTGAFPHIIVPDLGLGRRYNRLTHGLVAAIPRLMFGGVVDHWRREALRLPDRPRFASELVRADGRPVPVLLGFSPQVVEPPSDWPGNVHVTGFWFLDEGEGWEPPADLLAFLEAGPPPVFVSFGSMGGSDPAAKGRVVVEALEASGQRGLIVTGWGGLRISDPPPTVHVAEFAPYDWLLPRVSAVVHHGGAGTTAAGLRAGKPTVICPFVADQPFWGHRVAALGVGTRPIPQRRLTADKLAAAIRQAVADDSMRQRAAELGAKLRAEDGIAEALRVLDVVLAERSSRGADP